MRTVIISHAHPTSSLGGGEVAAYRQFRQMRADGADARFIGFQEAPEADDPFFGRFGRVVQIGEGDFCLRSRGMDADRMEHADLSEEDWLLEYLAEQQGDVYHFHHFWRIGAGTIRRLRKMLPQARFICTLHELVAICAHDGQMVKMGTNELCHEASPAACYRCFPQKSPLHFKIRRSRLLHLLDLFDVLISPSAFLRTRFEGWGVPKGRIRVLENGLEQSGPRPVESDTHLDSKARRFAFFGRCAPTKGLDVLVRAAAMLERTAPELAFSVDVYGATRAQFTALWPEITPPQSVIFHGAYAPDTAMSLMQRYGWIVLPSTWWENSPVIFQEARAAGTPVISSDIGGMLEKSQSPDLRFPTGDSAALAEVLRKLHGNAETLRRLKDEMPQPFPVSAYCRRLQAIVAESETRTMPTGTVNMKLLGEAGYAPYVRAGQRQDVLTIFQHIPKTAGSSLVHEIRCHIGAMRGIHIDYTRVGQGVGTDQLMSLSVEDFLASYDPSRTRCISGHLRRHHIDRIQAEIPASRVIVVLRDPVDRVISDYRYQCTPDHPPHERFREMCPTIRDYLHSVGEMNKMWMFMLDGEEDISAGLRLAEERYAFVGVMAHHAYTINTIMLLHGKDALPEFRVRKTRDNAYNRVEDDADLRAEIAAINTRDTALYTHFLKAAEAQQANWAGFRRAFDLA
ncbi:glycosyltransferase [Algicella marina]|uniref:Glycosyltransferase n=1 Tax=Algicella marina TaxID=2683284 RepID=A0A6P1T3K5_9RHOB|nr:glycosyltransferase [Algicella marina]QHQ36056.1 glycosyltransferase [Algicella marina]